MRKRRLIPASVAAWRTAQEGQAGLSVAPELPMARLRDRMAHPATRPSLLVAFASARTSQRCRDAVLLLLACSRHSPDGKEWCCFLPSLWVTFPHRVTRWVPISHSGPKFYAARKRLLRPMLTLASGQLRYFSLPNWLSAKASCFWTQHRQKHFKAWWCRGNSTQCP